MTDFLILLRNLVLAAILAWLGMEFAPKPDSTPNDKPDSAVAASHGR